MEENPTPLKRRPFWLRYAVGVVAVLAAVGARQLLDPWLGNSREFLTIFGAVVIAVWFGGVGPAVIAAVGGFLLADYFFVTPRETLRLEQTMIWSTAAGYFLSCGLIIGLGGVMRRARSRAESEARERAATESALRAKVAEHLEAEGKLRRQQAELEGVIHGTPFMLTRCNRDLEYVFVSPAYAAMLKRKPEEIAGKSIREVIGDEAFATVRSYIEKVLQGERVEYETDINFKGVSTRRVHVIYTPDRNEKDRVVGWFGSIVDRTEAHQAEEVLRQAARRQEALFKMASGLQGAFSLDAIYPVALDAIVNGLGCDRGSILLFDEEDKMRFVASRGLSDGYKEKVEGHTPWQPDTKNPEPICMKNIDEAELEQALLGVIQKEGIAALTFIPLVANDRVIGKFMGYFDSPHEFSKEETEMAMTIGRQLAFAVSRERAEAKLRESEERLRVATTTGKVGAWDWDIPADRLSWSDSIYAIHGVTRETFDGSVNGFQKLVHADDKERVSAAIARSLKDGSPYEATFRVVKPSGEVAWVFTNATVIRDGDKAVRMIGATTDVTDLKLAEEALRAAKLEAEEANRAKDQFLAALSHELRTPLTPVLMAATEMEVDPHLPRPAREQLSMMRRNIELEARLIDDLLDVTRIVHGKLELQQEILDVHASVEHAIKISASDMLAKQIQLTKKFNATEHLVLADAARLQEVFWNILRNAVKFTKPSGKIEITSRNDERRQQVIIEFNDDGIGVEPELQPRIFDTFAQGDRAMRARFGGLGLGLAISKRIIDMHGGSITVRSDGHDKGSTFTVVLKSVQQSAPLAATTNGNDEPAANSLGTILVVEDHEDTGRVLRRILESTGYETILCRSVAEAKETAAQKTFDLIVSDIGLPDGTGLDLMKAVRQHCDTPAVAISGYGTADDIRASEVAGFALHLTKPVDVSRLRFAISTLLDQEKHGDRTPAPAPVPAR